MYLWGQRPPRNPPRSVRPVPSCPSLGGRGAKTLLHRYPHPRVAKLVQKTVQKMLLIGVNLFMILFTCLL